MVNTWLREGRAGQGRSGVDHGFDGEQMIAGGEGRARMERGSARDSVRRGAALCNLSVDARIHTRIHTHDRAAQYYRLGYTLGYVHHMHVAQELRTRIRINKTSNSGV